MKCIVKNCQNHEHEGRFIGQLCSPCFGYLSTEEGVHSQAYRNVQKLVEQEREECANLCEEQIKAYMSNQYTTDPLGGFREKFASRQCATAIRARGEK
jgi:hypothetical protein